MDPRHHDPGRIPPAVPQRRDDPDAWRHGGHGPRRPNLSTTQILLGVIGLALLTGFIGLVIASTNSDGPRAEIVGPDPGETFAPGPVIVRIRVSSGSYTLSLSRPGAPGTWEELASGVGPVSPGIANGRQGDGLRILELTEPGTYSLRLTVLEQGAGESEAETQTVEFTVEG